jgi:hypothetical protein
MKDFKDNLNKRINKVRKATGDLKKVNNMHEKFSNGLETLKKQTNQTYIVN